MALHLGKCFFYLFLEPSALVFSYAEKPDLGHLGGFLLASLGHKEEMLVSALTACALLSGTAPAGAAHTRVTPTNHLFHSALHPGCLQ